MLISLPGCGGCSDYRNIPGGFAAKKLTPTGWQDQIYTSGQIDIGKTGTGGIGNTLVLVENTSVTVKESFLGPNANPDKEDHRLVCQDDMVPCSVDVRISFMSPDFSTSNNEADKLFTLITPEPYLNDSRMMVIKLEKVYSQLAKMSVRSTIRNVFDENAKNYKEAMANRKKMGSLIAVAILKDIKESGVPLKVKDVDLSMCMPDEAIWKINAQISSAEAQIKSIQKLAKEIDALPNGLEIYRLIMMREVVDIGSKNGTNTVIWPAGSPMTLPSKEKK